MNLTIHYPKGLTPSQQRSLIALIVGGLATLNDHWPQVTALVGAHYHGLPVPAWVTLALQIAALCITSLSRALNRAKSGTGQGIIGEPQIALPTTAAAPNFTPVLGDLFDLAVKQLPPPQVQTLKAAAAQMLADAEKDAALNMSTKIAIFAAAPAAPTTAPPPVIAAAPSAEAFAEPMPAPLPPVQPVVGVSVPLVAEITQE